MTGSHTRVLRRRRASVVVMTMVVASLLTTTTHAASPGFVTLLFGRMQWSQVGTVDGVTCRRLPNTVTLGRAHEDLEARGLDAVGVVIPSRTPATGLRCYANYATTAGWDTIAQWRAEGWRFVSGGSHRDIRSMSYEEQLAESCGSLDVFASHGIDASGMYAYGNNTWSLAAQTDPVSRCFDFGRTYAPLSPNRRAEIGAPWLQKTDSVNGGLCADLAAPCSLSATGGTTTRYQSPLSLAAAMRAAPDTWVAIQFYRFVTGAYAGQGWSWDCTSADWRRHWTSQAELYCYGDFLTIANALRAAVQTGGVVATDPASVAAAWGRVRTPPGPGQARETKARVVCPPGSPVGAAFTCRATVTDTDDGVPSLPTGAGSVRWTASAAGVFDPVACTPTGSRPTSSCATTFRPATWVRGAVTVTARYVGSPTHRPASGIAVVSVGSAPG